MGTPKNGRKRISVSTWVNELRTNGSHKITTRSNVIADSHGTTARHGLIDHNSKRIVSRRKDQKIRGGVDRRELRLIEETQESDARSYAEAGCFGLN